jgi:hypothetical protein
VISGRTEGLPQKLTRETGVHQPARLTEIRHSSEAKNPDFRELFPEPLQLLPLRSANRSENRVGLINYSGVAFG